MTANDEPGFERAERCFSITSYQVGGCAFTFVKGGAGALMSDRPGITRPQHRLSLSRLACAARQRGRLAGSTALGIVCQMASASDQSSDETLRQLAIECQVATGCALQNRAGLPWLRLGSRVPGHQGTSRFHAPQKPHS
jgi:hypothetical protein